MKLIITILLTTVLIVSCAIQQPSKTEALNVSIGLIFSDNTHTLPPSVNVSETKAIGYCISGLPAGHYVKFDIVEDTKITLNGNTVFVNRDDLAVIEGSGMITTDSCGNIMLKGIAPTKLSNGVKLRIRAVLNGMSDCAFSEEFTVVIAPKKRNLTVLVLSGINPKTVSTVVATLKNDDVVKTNGWEVLTHKTEVYIGRFADREEAKACKEHMRSLKFESVKYFPLPKVFRLPSNS